MLHKNYSLKHSLVLYMKYQKLCAPLIFVFYIKLSQIDIVIINIISFVFSLIKRTRVIPKF